MNYRNHFTSRAIKAIEFAQYASRELEQDYIGTEHLLLGLLHEEGSVAAAAMQAVGLRFDDVMQRVETMVAGDAEYPADNPYYTPRAKRVMEGAIEEAQTLGHNYIGTEHILLSLLEETEGAAAELLANMGVDIDALQNEVLDRIDHPHPEGDGPEPGRAEKGKGRQAPQLLKKYGRNLNDMAKEDRMDPVIGRDKEIQRVIQILARRTKNNPILLGGRWQDGHRRGTRAAHRRGLCAVHAAGQEGHLLVARLNRRRREVPRRVRGAPQGTHRRGASGRLGHPLHR